MPLIIPPGYAQIVHNIAHSADDRAYAVTYGIALSPVALSDQEIVNETYTIWEEEWDGLTDDGITFVSTTMYVGQDGGPPTVFESDNGANFGTQPGSYLPQNNALLIRKRTAAAGRRNRGRMYLPFVLLEGVVTDTGQIDGGYLASLQTAATNVFNRHVADLEAPMVILHTSSPDQATPPGSPTTITSLQVDSVIATQRTRLRR